MNGGAEEKLLSLRSSEVEYCRTMPSREDVMIGLRSFVGSHGVEVTGTSG